MVVEDVGTAQRIRLPLCAERHPEVKFESSVLD